MEYIVGESRERGSRRDGSRVLFPRYYCHSRIFYCHTCYQKISLRGTRGPSISSTSSNEPTADEKPSLDYFYRNVYTFFMRRNNLFINLIIE